MQHTSTEIISRRSRLSFLAQFTHSVHLPSSSLSMALEHIFIPDILFAIDLNSFRFAAEGG